MKTRTPQPNIQAHRSEFQESEAIRKAFAQDRPLRQNASVAWGWAAGLDDWGVGRASLSCERGYHPAGSRIDEARPTRLKPANIAGPLDC